MAKHPLNLTVRFLLELVAIFITGLWGYHVSENATGILYAILCPLDSHYSGVFLQFPNDPSRSGKTVITTPGILRLILELSLFAAATWMMYDLGYSAAWWVYASIVLVHYAISHERVSWLLKQK